MGELRIEDYVPAGEIVVKNLSVDLPSFTPLYKNINNVYLQDFRNLIGEVKELESVFSITEEQKLLTNKLYYECDTFVNRLMFMKSYVKEVKLNYSIITAIIRQLRNRNIEGAIQSGRDALGYYNTKIELLNESNMPEGFLEDLIKKLERIEILNNEHNSFIINRKAKVSKNKATYNRLYFYISEVCKAGKMVFGGNAEKREEYTIRKIVSVLQSSRKRREGNDVPDIG
ncbi:MAG: hypothetical protein LBV41_07160 [Cytophagaceae bacterium]|jgi:hypothetical protein|nr:hypothetical protein [Cytophagaceae bacterium]